MPERETREGIEEVHALMQRGHEKGEYVEVLSLLLISDGSGIWSVFYDDEGVEVIDPSRFGSGRRLLAHLDKVRRIEESTDEDEDDDDMPELGGFA